MRCNLGDQHLKPRPKGYSSNKSQTDIKTPSQLRPTISNVIRKVPTALTKVRHIDILTEKRHPLRSAQTFSKSSLSSSQVPRSSRLELNYSYRDRERYIKTNKS